MKNILDLSLPSGRTLGDVTLEPVLSAGCTPLVVDVGARNGMMLLPESYTRHARCISFEPNEPEYRKLVDGKTDAAAHGYMPTSFKETQYFNCALWDRDEKRNLHVTVGPGATSLMGYARPSITQRMFLYAGANGKSYEDEHTTVKKTEQVDCRALDGLLPGETIDFLKIDVEGAELRVLQGAKALLEQHNILFIKSEFVLLPYYDEHPLLGHQQVFLDGLSYRLIGMDLDQSSYARDHTTIPADADRRLRYAGDAYYIPDPDRLRLDPLKLQRIAIVSMMFGFRSLAVSLFKDGGLPAERIAEIERALGHMTGLRRARLAWQALPYKAWNVIGGLLRR
jgi:FkbM family methyltransferase